MYTEEYVLKAIDDLLETSEGEGRQTVLVDKSKLHRLREVMALARGYNDAARNIKYLTKLALETQTACNPRPVVTLLSNLIFTVMQDGGNPAFESSPAVRVALNTLLNVYKYRSLPHYDDGYASYSNDIDAMEALLKEDLPTQPIGAN